MDIDSILERLAQNESLAQQFHKLESRILSILNYRDFFEILLTSIESMFNIPRVWLTIIDDSPLAESIRAMNDSELLVKQISFVSYPVLTRILDGQSSVLANHKLHRFTPLFPSDNFMDINSIAVTSIVMDGSVIGSLNQADTDINRFEPGMNTDLLERLALKISLCLMNVSAHEQLRFLAYHDTLTGLLNRRVMESILHREFERSQRYSTDLTVVFIDLDRFKQINDTYGHDQGDAALIHVADCLNTLRRNSDVVARFAGDEFVILLPSTTATKARSFTDRLVAYLAENPLSVGDAKVTIRLSCGIASITESGVTSPEALLKLSDHRLYQEKKKRP